MSWETNLRFENTEKSRTRLLRQQKTRKDIQDRLKLEDQREFFIKQAAEEERWAKQIAWHDQLGSGTQAKTMKRKQKMMDEEAKAANNTLKLTRRAALKHLYETERSQFDTELRNLQTKAFYHDRL